MRLERLRQQTIQSIQSIDEKIASAQDQGNVAFVENLNQQRKKLVTDEIGQREYAKIILQIGSGIVENTDHISFHDADPVTFSTTYKYRPTKVFVLEDKAEGEQWLEYNARSTEAKIAALRYFYPQGSILQNAF